MQYETVTYESRDRIGYITLNRPDSLNAVNDALERDLLAAYEEFDFDDDAWIAILHGNGRCFCAGADIKQRFAGPGREDRHRRMSRGRNPEGYIGRTTNWKPVVGAIHSHALGAGMAIALECDLLVASEDARFGITEIKRGLQGATVWAKMQTFMASKVATEALLLGDPMPAAELHRLGLINRLVPNGQHLPAAEELARRLLEVPPLPVRAGVRVSRWQWVRAVSEADYYIQPLRLHLSEDFEESSRAFVQKRKPTFHGR